MKKNRFILLLVVVLMQSVSVIAQKATKTITDSETGMVVPNAAIYKSDNTFLCFSNVDGVFSIEVTSGSFYKVTHIGYKPITLTAEQLLSDKAIKMEMLAYELNPVVVTPDAALLGINRALESSRKRIPSTPFYMRCYKKEEIVSANDTYIDAKAIIDIGIRKVTSTRSGALVRFSLKGLHVDRNNTGLDDIMPRRYPKNSSIFPINIGFSEKDYENIVFTLINAEIDSLTIIAYHPKKYFSGESVYTSGRFIIDARTGCILRIDMTLDNSSIEYLSHLAESTNATRIMHRYSVRIFYNAKSLPSKVEQKTVYYLKDKPDKLFTWTVLQVYKDISKADFKQKQSGTYDYQKVVFEQKPVTMPDFDTHFNQGFQ